jgi:hypothetical protein
MPEKVISEIRFVETDDGFRIEFKGDKERWRQMGFDPGQWQWGHKRRQGHGPHHGHGHHHHKHGRHWHGCSPSFEAGSWWGHWDEEPPERA